MQTNRTFVDDLKHQYKHGGMTIRLIFINVAIFLILNILNVFLELGGMQKGLFITEYVYPIFGLHTTFNTFITHPWTLITSLFAHYDFWHLLFNMIFLYVSGRFFEQLFDQKKLLYTYLLGGIFGGLLELLAHGLLPKLAMFDNVVVVGASGSIMAIFMAVGFYRPNMKVHLFGIFPVRLIILAVLFLLKDLLNLANMDGTAHFAHLGGAVLGILSIQNLHSSGNIINRAQQFGDWVQRLFARNKGPRLKVKKGNKSGFTRVKTDEEYNIEAKLKQQQIDKILDKISKSGYESLTRQEKDFLFNQSKK